MNIAELVDPVDQAHAMRSERRKRALWHEDKLCFPGVKFRGGSMTPGMAYAGFFGLTRNQKDTRQDCQFCDCSDCQGGTVGRPWRDEEVWQSFVPRKDFRGKAMCEMHGCPNVLKGKQERWCSKVCVFNALATCQWSVARPRILKRDGHKCVKCFSSACEVDHIVPLCEGGSLCDPSNLRTLCADCHKKETAALAKRRAANRRSDNEAQL